MSDFQAWLDAAWQRHEVDPAVLVREVLQDGPSRAGDPAQVQACMHLLHHLIGEHVGDWSAGREALQACPSWAAWAPELAPVLQRYDASLAWCAGDTEPVDALPPEDAAAALALAAAACSARHDFSRAVQAHDLAWEAAHAAKAASQWPDASPAWRALAVAGNNLATDLAALSQRTDALRGAMLRAAEGAVAGWRRAGTWLQQERAEYRMADVLVRAQRPQEALAAAQRCMALCEAHQAPPFERFFAMAVAARACQAAGDIAGFALSRKAALHWHAQVAADEQPWCDTERAALG